MTYPQRITHSPGRNIGFRRKVSKLLRRRQKSNPTSSEESSKTLPKTHLPDLVSDSYAAYREAAKSDSFLFGDYDGYQAFEDLDQEDP